MQLMAEKLKIISLGGLDEIGKNMTVFEYGEDIIVVDCGMGFPDFDMYGVDIIVPDASYLYKNQSKVRAMFITHGHEDHIGSIPYIIDELNVPVYATKFTAGLIELKLGEHKLTHKTEVVTVKAGSKIKAGCFSVEFIHVNHSIPDAVAFAINTPVGTVVHTGDFKIDTTPIEDKMADIVRFGELGRRGVLALLSESTNVEREGFSVSESKVGRSLDNYFKDCENRIIVTTFASNVHRIQQVINSAAKYGRKVAVTGRSMENVLKLAVEYGYIKAPQGVLVDVTKLKNLPKNEIVIITTGSQGEAMSALYRMAFSVHKQVELIPGDRIIISASAIPGNEKTIYNVINELYAKGAEVIYEKAAALHVSGHACQEELRMILALTKPKYFIPIHGEHRHLMLHAKIAREMGINPKNVIVAGIGDVIEMNGRNAKITGTVPSGKIFVDGSGVGDVGSVVLRDRKHLAQDGMLVAIVSLSGEDGSLVSGPDIISRGFIYVKESEELIAEMKEVIIRVLDDCDAKRISDWTTIKAMMRGRLSDYLYKKTRRNPMILPVIMEV